MTEQYLIIKMFVLRQMVQDCLEEISKIETDEKMSVETKLLEIEKIKKELTKVGAEVDILKKEIKLLSTCNIN